MNCKNCRIRSKNYKKYIYCTALKKEINFSDCECCYKKEYKQYKTIKKKKHKRTIATDISKETKLEVWNRDKRRCIFCGKTVSPIYANAHFIPRSAGGLGIPKNVFTACSECHHEQDNGLNCKIFDTFAENYLREIYGIDWNVKELLYVKH